jgi:hypothetical protein
MSDEIKKFLELLREVVNGEGSWKERRQRIWDESDEQDKTNLAEFAAWFDE